MPRPFRRLGVVKYKSLFDEVGVSGFSRTSRSVLQPDAGRLRDTTRLLVLTGGSSTDFSCLTIFSSFLTMFRVVNFPPSRDFTEIWIFRLGSSESSSLSIPLKINQDEKNIKIRRMEIRKEFNSLRPRCQVFR